MDWYWKPASPKTLYITLDVACTIFLILSIFYTYLGIFVADEEHIPFTLTMGLISASISITLWAIGMAYWSIINKILENEKGLPKGAE